MDADEELKQRLQQLPFLNLGAPSAVQMYLWTQEHPIKTKLLAFTAIASVVGAGFVAGYLVKRRSCRR
jgi:hypothetical protein